MAAVRRIEFDVLKEPFPPSSTVEEPTAKDVEELFEQLDGERIDSCVLEISDENYLGVAWGGGFVVSIRTPGISYQLVGDASATGDVVIRMGGQDSDAPARLVTEKPRALKAAKYYLESGSPDPSLTWEEEHYEV
ncbi:MAG TPA: Imm1 family immunity protein [Thermoanaerobaculia bacterium]|nr:Imm1 family immunity protein [Thermoanaerobaculia bacterium]